MYNQQFELIDFDQEGDRIFSIGDCQQGYVAEFADQPIGRRQSLKTRNGRIAYFAKRNMTKTGGGGYGYVKPRAATDLKGSPKPQTRVTPKPQAVGVNNRTTAAAASGAGGGRVAAAKQKVSQATGQVKSHLRRTRRGGIALVKTGYRKTRGARKAAMQKGRAAGGAISRGGRTVGRVIANNPKTAAAAAAGALALGVGAKVIGGRRKRRRLKSA